MANFTEIKCINKNDRASWHERITHVGGFVNDRWKITIDRAIELIENEGWQFFITVNGKRADVIVQAAQSGRKYLRTVADRDNENNLLSLPECP